MAWKKIRIEDKGLRNDTKDFVRGHYERLEELETIAWSSPSPGGPSRGSGPGRPTESKAIKAARISRDVQAVEKALEKIPEYFRGPVLAHVVDRTSWPRIADQRTYRHYQDKFLWYVNEYRERLPRV